MQTQASRSAHANPKSSTIGGGKRLTYARGTAA